MQMLLRPANTSGIIVRNVSPIACGFPTIPSQSAAYPTIGSYPLTNITMAPTSKPKTTDNTGTKILIVRSVKNF